MLACGEINVEVRHNISVFLSAELVASAPTDQTSRQLPVRRDLVACKCAIVNLVYLQISTLLAASLHNISPQLVCAPHFQCA